MKHSIGCDGYSYRLRPVTVNDAAFIVEVRLEDAERNRFIHPISPDVEAQVHWIENYFSVPNDYYFVIENKITNQSEGLISLYNIIDAKAEWGRWVIKKNSPASVESFYLICRVAFENLNLIEIFSKTIEDNKMVVAFHDGAKAKRRGIIPNCYTYNGFTYNVIEHFVAKDYFVQEIQPRLDKMCRLLFERLPPPPRGTPYIISG